MNKDFNILEKVMCNMADNFYQPVEFPLYVKKLEKEFAELMEQLTKDGTLDSSKEWHHFKNAVLDNLPEIKDELADVLCFLLRISNSFKISGTELLHHAMSKMVRRIGDENYNRV
ncbi:MazG nucleotide pyrophosphohydrolase domain-containing protein [Mucilaginibacter xinganensis]|uniref:NTP pyrophosphohydrolase MazG-like domain-containing protein n=1 Tax=Mucilaginibacter xinganensis TaxID=1234841 RepID=A0A223NWX6_9SPHI|nr:MazG nucleotide pyrophosphohydrolase domain-containing protein [Mucilaginibacter xinganensis]ASU34377.1 hypothetical protein MuYL_2490 [Mucilaginibacter xinganensis]